MVEPNALMALPFVVLLATIALGPLFFADWWGKNYGKVAGGLALLTAAYYLTLGGGGRVVAVAQEYVSFIVLIGSLFVVAGGIRMTVKGEATPIENVRFLFCGALAANLLGTTGASMLLIRPWLRMNKYRVSGHHVVFFIFLISNVGGCLTPIGDPPLYLGFLKGVPFFWVVQHCWPMWAVGVGMLLAMFYWIDRQNYLRAPQSVRERLAEPPDEFRFEGMKNIVFLAVILGSAFISRPVFLREAIMAAAAAASWFITPAKLHAENDFSFSPLKEVALLFVGIFATMMPALDWLHSHAGSFGSLSPTFYYFASGSLSSVLDNAPTYLTFFNVATSAIDAPPVPQSQAALLLADPELSRLLMAISVGSVFFGANTYIGNGPNFMVKAIADQQKVHTPTFLAYIWKYTLPFMLTMLVVVWALFFRGTVTVDH